MRHVILHYHVYKNAGTTIDSILQKNFGAACGSVEGTDRWDTLEAQDILERDMRTALAKKPDLARALERLEDVRFFRSCRIISGFNAEDEELSRR